MKKLLLLSFAALAILFMYSCQKENLYTENEDTELQLRESNKIAVTPFKGTYTTYPMISETGDYAEITGEGWATHLGKSEWFGEGGVDFSDNPPSQEGFCYFVSANKDTLFGNFIGTISPFPTNPIFVGVGTYEITSGTGRFVGTTGHGIYEYEINVQEDFTIQGELIWDGVLINP